MKAASARRMGIDPGLAPLTRSNDCKIRHDPALIGA